VTPVRGVTVSADLPGIVERIGFESGRTVREGDVLVQLDTRQERAQLAAAEAQRNLTKLSLDRYTGLRDKGVVSQADYDRAAAEYEQAVARVGEMKATIGRKTIRAPFGGVLGIRQVNLGQYMKAGDPIVPLQQIRPIYVDFSVVQQQVANMPPGTDVRITTEEKDKGGLHAVARVTAVDAVVNEATRNVQVRATLENADGALHPGMYVQAHAQLGQGQKVVALPASAVNYAPYGDSVFIVSTLTDPKGHEYKGVRQQFVKLGGGRGDQIAVVSGVKAGDEVVTSGVFKLRNGAAVLVDNTVVPGNNPAPKPEDS